MNFKKCIRFDIKNSETFCSTIAVYTNFTNALVKIDVWESNPHTVSVAISNNNSVFAGCFLVIDVNRQTKEFSL